MVEKPEVKERPRGNNNKGIGLFGDGIKLNISLSKGDKELLEEKLDSMSDRIEKNWRITQWIMGIAVTLSVIGEIINVII
jgi:hypothetical protein